MLGKRIINTATGAAPSACTTDTVQILDGVPFQSIATYELDGDAESSVKTGYIGNAAEFNGSNSYIDTGISSLGPNFSVSLWINEVSLDSGGYFGNWNATSSDDMFWRTNTDGSIRISFDGGPTQSFGSAGDITANNWHNIVVTFNNGTINVYADGNSKGSTTTANTVFNSGANFYIGDDNSGTFFNGKIDQVRIFNKALSSSEVTTLYGETSASSTKSTTDIFADSSGIALYELEGNANDTGGTYNGTATNVAYGYDGTASNVSYSTGQFGQAAVFNGSSSKINLPTISNIKTYSFWINPDSTGNSVYARRIFGDIGGTSYTNSITFDPGVGKIVYYEGTTARSGDTVPYNTWTHIALTSDGTTLNIYTNGTLSNTYTTSGFISSIEEICSTSSNRQFKGSIDQVRIYDKAISAADVTTLYNETVATASTNITLEVPSLVAYYKMNDATDETGSYDGTPTNVNFNVAGKFGNAGEFNGSSSVIDFSQPLLINTFSVSFFIKTSNSSTQRILGNPYGGAGDYGFNIRTESSTGHLEVEWSANGTNAIILDTGQSVIDGNWHHIVAVWSNGSQKIYIDNVEEASSTNANDQYATTDTFKIGANWNNTGWFNGSIDQVRIFDRAITADEVTTLYNEVYCQPTIVPTDHFEPVLYTGNGSTQSISTLDFAPDFVWMKDRDTTNYEHVIFDSVRGTGTSHILSSDLTSQEGWSTNGSLTSFDSNGFTLPNTVLNNANGHNYVAWNWKAGGATVSNTDGTITSQVSANVDAGFSIVKYTGNGTAGATVGHGIDTPELIIVKELGNTNNWQVYSSSIGANKFLYLNSTLVATSATNRWNDTTPTSTVFTVGDSLGVNRSSGNFIAYCFHSVDGMSKIGSYVGTGAASNSIVTGFRPAYVMIKKTSGTSRWRIVDNKRDIENPRSKNLFAEDSIAETGRPTHTTQDFNFHSNGFEIPANMDGELNQSGASFIFMAFAEEVFDPNGVTRNATDPFGDSSEVALYKFEDNANDAEGSYNGTASNVTYSTGYIDKAAVFNGSSSKIQLSQTYGAEGETFSYSFWFNTSTNAGSTEDEYIISKRNGENTFNIRIHTDGKIAVNNWTGAGTLNTHEVRSTSSYTDGNWHHFAFTYDGNAATKTICYIDGSRDTSMDWTYNLVTQSISNGNVLGQVDFGGRAYTGKIDQVRIFDRALDAGEVTQLYNE